MKFKLLNKKNNDNLIVFFNGWGFDEKIVSTLRFGEFDVVTFFDYQNFPPIDIDFSMYKKKYLVAWSLGVSVADLYFDVFKNFDGFTAVNGTQLPINDDFGIPNNAYNLTIENFNELTCLKFIRKINAPIQITKKIQELKNELIQIKNIKPTNFLNYNKAIISNKDRIFPPKNMLAYWNEKRVKIQEIDAPHYVFDKFENWSHLI